MTIKKICDINDFRINHCKNTDRFFACKDQQNSFQAKYLTQNGTLSATCVQGWFNRLEDLMQAMGKYMDLERVPSYSKLFADAHDADCIYKAIEVRIEGRGFVRPECISIKKMYGKPTILISEIPDILEDDVPF